MVNYLYMYMLLMKMLFCFFLSMYFLINKINMYFEFEFFKILSIKVEYLILIDWMSLLFISVMLMISLSILFYSIEYMSSDLNINRFMMLMMLFVFSMIFMIISPNMISILIGWDGLGLVSFCLVIFYQNENSFISGMVTVLMNRVGDVMILILISMMLYIGSWNFMILFSMENFMLMMIILISFTKSAQIPFSSWLPMAMAAPTPVSSLVHSSTLVTAGVYLLIRFNYLISANVYFMQMMMFISLLTLVMSGIGANLEYDLKKIIALSTLSQLGVMIFCLSLGLPEVSLFHLLTHAMFKSMLFMCSGVIIHNMMLNQDIRFISMVTFNMPLISMIFNCSNLSLCGMPFLSGFFSKDKILEMYLMSLMNQWILIILFFSMGLTVSYMLRLLYYSFIKFPGINLFLKTKILYNKMSCSMLMLFLMTLFMGYLLSWLIFSMKNYIYLSMNFKLMIYKWIFMGVIMSFIMNKIYFSNIFLFKMTNLLKFFMNLWFIMYMYSMLVKFMMFFMKKLVFLVDLSWNEFILGGGLMNYLKKIFFFDLYKSNFFYLMFFIFYLILIMIL